MARVSLLAALVLCLSVPARAQDVITDQAGYADKGYCTYTYVVPPGSRTGTFSPPRLEEQLSETKEETGRLKNQVDLLTSLVQTLLSQQSDFTTKVDSLSAELSEEKIRSAQLEQNLTRELREQEARLQAQEQNLTQELQEKETRLQTQVQNLTTTLSEYDVIIKQRLQCTCERLVAGDVSSSTAARLSSGPGSTAAAPLTKMTSPTESQSITQSAVAGDVSSSTAARLSSWPGSTAAVPLTKMTSPTVTEPQSTTQSAVAGDVSSSTEARLSSEPGSTAAAPLTKMTSPTEPLSITQSGVAGDVSSSTSARLSSGPGSTAVAPLTKMTSPTDPQSTTQSAETTAAAEITTSTQPNTHPSGTELAGSTTRLELQVRLADGRGPLEGRVEVQNGTGQWGSVCDDNFDLQDAHVVCRQLGFGTALEVKLAGHFGEGSGNVWLDEVACRGDETNLGDCPADSWGRSDCSHKEDAGVVCGEKSAVRLAGGHVPWEGRVEFRPGEKSEWGAVCNTGWTEADANFVCRQLGHTGGVTASGLNRFGESTGRIWLGDVACSGKETNILSCGFTWEPSDCDHRQDVAVVCKGGVSVRLSGSDSPSEGRVKIRPGNDAWGTICDDGFDDRDAQVVCTQLGYVWGAATVGRDFEEGTGIIWLENVDCVGNESSLMGCESNSLRDDVCTNGKDAGVNCTDDVSVRLTRTNSAFEGRVEIRPGGLEWGTICDDGFDDRDAQVVCRQLGFRSGVAMEGGDFGEGEGLMWLQKLDCVGNESSIAGCQINRWGDHDCTHKENAGVVCTGEVFVRLTGGQSPSDGRVEVRPGNGDWGTICDDRFDDRDAQVVCRQLGYDSGFARVGGVYPEGTGNILLYNLSCAGNESSVADCLINGWGDHDCTHKEDAGVVCGLGKVFVRLVGSQIPSQGRVEIRPGNENWGTICDDGFDDRDAQVVCRHLGYHTGYARVGGVFPEGTGNIWLDNLNCAGNESSVADCQINRWGDHDCTHKEDVGVVCVPASDCADHFASGQTTSGVYNIRVNHSDVEVYCDMDTAEGGWTVIQRRQDGSVPFNRNWEEYRQGFGNKNEEYWLGNENIHLLTSQKNYKLRIELLDWSGDSRFAEYSTFRVSGESDQYRLQIAGYSGTAEDYMTGAHHSLNGQMFSAVDRDNDSHSSVHCSQLHGQAGWWFRSCGASINGRYLGNCGNSCPTSQGVVWAGWRGHNYSLKSVSMKIKPY